MGLFSLIDCKDGSQILIGENVPSYVLVPEEYREKYGDVDSPHHIEHDYYMGDGIFGRYDIYDLVADWNKDSLRERLGLNDKTKTGLTDQEYDGISNNRRPRLEDFTTGMYKFEKEDLAKKGYSEAQIEELDLSKRKENWERNVRYYDASKRMLYDFLTDKLSDEEMEEKYGEEYKREVGICISGDDKMNAQLQYPIKVTHDASAIYEEEAPSIWDEYQGRYHNKVMEKTESIMEGMTYYCEIQDNYAMFQLRTSDGYDMPFEIDYDGTAEDFAATVSAYAEGLDLDLEPEVTKELKEQLRAIADKLNEALQPGIGEDPEL